MDFLSSFESYLLSLIVFEKGTPVPARLPLLDQEKVASAAPSLTVCSLAAIVSLQLCTKLDGNGMRFLACPEF